MIDGRGGELRKVTALGVGQRPFFEFVCAYARCQSTSIDHLEVVDALGE